MNIAIIVGYCILFFAMPFHRVATSIPMVLLFVTNLLVLLFVKAKNYKVSSLGDFKWHTHKSFAWWISAIIFWLGLHVVFLFKAADLSDVKQELFIKIMLLILPLLFYYNRNIILKYQHLIVKSLIAGCVMFGVLSIMNGLRSYELGVHAFTYVNLISFTDFNPIYLSIIYNAAIVYCIMHFKKEGNKIFWAILCLLLFLFLLLLQSRIGLIAAVLIFNWGVLFLMAPNNWFKKMGVLVLANVLLLALTFTSIKDNPRFQRSYEDAMVFFQNGTLDNTASPRLIIWQESKIVAKEHFAFGVGTGNVRNALMEKFETRDFQKGLYERFNAHNQVLQSTIEFGWLGTLATLLIFFIPLVVGIKNKQAVLILVVSVLLLYSLIESILETQAGVVFTSLFISIAWWKSKQLTRHSKKG